MNSMGGTIEYVGHGSANYQTWTCFREVLILVVMLRLEERQLRKTSRFFRGCWVPNPRDRATAAVCRLAWVTVGYSKPLGLLQWPEKEEDEPNEDDRLPNCSEGWQQGQRDETLILGDLFDAPAWSYPPEGRQQGQRD